MGNLKHAGLLLLVKSTRLFKLIITNLRMLLPEELYKHIPRKVQLWTPKDVQRWFKLNSLHTIPSFQFQDQNFDGPSFIQVSPDYLLNKCGVASHLVMKRILEWIDQQRKYFDQYVESLCSTSPIQSNSEKAIAQLQQKGALNKENCPKNQNCSIVVQKHYEAIMPLEQVKKWNKKRRSVSIQNQAQHSAFINQIELKVSKIKSQSETPSDIRFVESTYEMCQHKLIFQYALNQQVRTIELKGSGFIGRKKQCQVLVEQDSVSRVHCQILKRNSQFWLRDNESSYGTFVQIGRDRRKHLEEGDVLNFDDQFIQIVKIKINNAKGMANFDLKVKTFKNKDPFLNFYRRVVVLVGRKERDITINSPNVMSNHARIVLENDNRLYLVKEEGHTFIRLKKEELYQLQLPQETILLGLQKVEVKLRKESKPVPNISQFLVSKY